MGSHALTISWLSGLRYQDMVREVSQQRRIESTETEVWRRPLASIVAIVTVFALTLAAPAAAQVAEPPLAAARVGPSWDEISGYGAVEASRAAIGEDSQTCGHEVRAASGPSWDETSGYGAVEARRSVRN